MDPHRNLSAKDYAAVQRAHHTQRVLVQVQSVFGLWTVFMDQPDIKGLIRLIGMRIHSRKGLSFNAEVSFEDFTATVEVGHETVALIPGKVFARIPETFDYRKPEGNASVRVPLLLWSEGSPKETVEGELVATPVSALRQMFSKFEGLRL